MARKQQSAVNELVRKLAIAIVALFGSVLLIHFFVPAIDIWLVIDSFVSLSMKFPEAIGILVLGLIIIFAMAFVDDVLR